MGSGFIGYVHADAIADVGVCQAFKVGGERSALVIGAEQDSRSGQLVRHHLKRLDYVSGGNHFLGTPVVTETPMG